MYTSVHVIFYLARRFGIQNSNLMFTSSTLNDRRTEVKTNVILKVKHVLHVSRAISTGRFQ